LGLIPENAPVFNPVEFSGNLLYLQAMKIALYQGPGKINDVEASWLHLAEVAAQAKAGGADLLILPEMYLSGYNIGAEAALSAAVTQASLAPAQGIAKTNGIALVFGYPELVGDQVANSAALIGPDGALLLNYRKTHLFGALDREMFKSVGDAFGLAEWEGFKIGLLICYDIEFPEPARALALAGADILLIPTAQMQPYTQVAKHVIPTRAYENQLYIAYANHSGSDDGLDYVGLSSICGPDGAVLAAAGVGEELIYATIDESHQAKVRETDPLLYDRRPELYESLSKRSLF
jgi:predicted amidohydrolase